MRKNSLYASTDSAKFREALDQVSKTAAASRGVSLNGGLDAMKAFSSAKTDMRRSEDTAIVKRNKKLQKTATKIEDKKSSTQQ